MTHINVLKQLFMKYVFFLFLLTAIFSCENHRYESDKRQIMAKDEIQSKLRGARAFDITGFMEDTVQNDSDSNFKKQIRYTLDFVYQDSNKVEQKKRGIVMFTPDGASIINSQITDK